MIILVQNIFKVIFMFMVSFLLLPSIKMSSTYLVWIYGLFELLKKVRALRFLWRAHSNTVRLCAIIFIIKEKNYNCKSRAWFPENLRFDIWVAWLMCIFKCRQKLYWVFPRLERWSRDFEIRCNKKCLDNNTQRPRWKGIVNNTSKIRTKIIEALHLKQFSPYLNFTLFDNGCKMLVIF